MPHDSPAGTTITLSPPGSVGAVVARPIRAASGFDEELRQLLRSRLLLFQLLTIVYAALLMVMAAFTPEDSQVRSDQVQTSFSVMLILPLIGTVAIWRSPGMSLRSLRLWELFQFSSQAIINGVFRFAALALATSAMPVVEVGFRGAISLFGIMTLILAYGVLIPNTPRRSLLVVLGLIAVPFAALIAATAANPALRWDHFPALVFQAGANLFIPAAIAVFAAARANALQRRAFEAERRANEIGQYMLKDKLGEGGMGEVWLAEHRLLKRPCAVKFIRADLAANPSTAARFEREVQAVTGLTHFNTVRVYDYGRADDGSFYYVMEFLDGPTLESLVKRVGPLEPGRVVYLLRQLCGALAEAHAAGLIHRDVKPGNVIVAALGGQRDVAKLLDFGLVQDLATADNRLTGAGVVLGTPAYMCPEQAGGSIAVDERGDVYSLGAMAFFALTGQPPFDRSTVGAFLSAHLIEIAPDLRSLRPDTPDDLAAIVARCLAKLPGERYSSALELDRALAGCVCAHDWSAVSAMEWWAKHGDIRTAAGSFPTATFVSPEAARR